jgi:hypothetical protein
MPTAPPAIFVPVTGTTSTAPAVVFSPPSSSTPSAPAVVFSPSSPGTPSSPAVIFSPQGSSATTSPDSIFVPTGEGRQQTVELDFDNGGFVVSSGSINIAVSSALTEDPLVVGVTIEGGMTGAQVAAAIRTAFAAYTPLTDLYNVGGAGFFVTLQKKVKAANDLMFLIELAEGEGGGELEAFPETTTLVPGIAPVSGPPSPPGPIFVPVSITATPSAPPAIFTP